MITLKDISTYTLIEQIKDNDIVSSMHTYGIDNYQSLYVALENKLIPNTKQIKRALLEASKLTCKSHDINIPILKYDHNTGIDYDVIGLDIGLDDTICKSLNMKTLIYLYTHIDMNGKLCLDNYPGITLEKLPAIKTAIYNYDKVIYPRIRKEKAKSKILK